jgi:integrase/recombinase XerD
MKAYLEPEEVMKLEQAADNLRDKLLIRLLFRLGCRISEVLGIDVKDIDFKRGMVTIEHLKVRIRLSCPACGARLSKAAHFCPGCGAKVDKVVAEEKEHRRQRSLPVDKETLAMLRNYINRGGPVGNNGRYFLFGLKQRRAHSVIGGCALKAGLEPLVNPETGETRGISPHRLRDAFAVHAIKVDDSTDSVRLLQEQLGHQSIDTTMKYRKVAGKDLREWYDRIWDREAEPATLGR